MKKYIELMIEEFKNPSREQQAYEAMFAAEEIAEKEVMSEVCVTNARLC